MPYNVTVATGMARRMYVLRGGVLARDCIARTLRIDVPVTPNTVTSCSGKSLLWLGPEEWLLNVPEGEEDPLAGGYSPIEAKVGPKDMMIQGFKEGLKLLGTGDKATLFIPYYLAYGETESRGIPAKSNLIFEVEIVDQK